jgi:hypothetical protein
MWADASEVRIKYLLNSILKVLHILLSFIYIFCDISLLFNTEIYYYKADKYNNYQLNTAFACISIDIEKCIK